MLWNIRICERRSIRVRRRHRLEVGSAAAGRRCPSESRGAHSPNRLSRTCVEVIPSGNPGPKGNRTPPQFLHGLDVQVIEAEGLVRRVAELDLLGLAPGEREEGFALGTKSFEHRFRRETLTEDRAVAKGVRRICSAESVRHLIFSSASTVRLPRKSGCRTN